MNRSPQEISDQFRIIALIAFVIILAIAVLIQALRR